MDDNTKKALMAVGVGVGAVGAVATAMYYLGGREAPKVPSLDELSAFGKREFLFGAVATKEERLQRFRNRVEELKSELRAWREETGLYEDDDDPYFVNLANNLHEAKQDLKDFTELWALSASAAR